MPKNLIKNSCGEEQLRCWENNNSGGDGWQVEDLPGDTLVDFPIPGVKKYFASSFQWCSKSQVINLLNEGYTAELLDNTQPDIVVSDWYTPRPDIGCEYELTVQLLSGDRKVIDEFKTDKLTIPKRKHGTWNQIIHTFHKYGPGVRYISFTHGGKDLLQWKGWYGVRVTNSSVTISK